MYTRYNPYQTQYLPSHDPYSGHGRNGGYGQYGGYGGGYNMMPVRDPYERFLKDYKADREFLKYVARLASHDQQANGWKNPHGPQGTIFLQVIADQKKDGKINGQSKIFLDTEERRKWFKIALEKSRNPETGKLDGRFLRQSIADAYWDATGVDVMPAMSQAPLLQADYRKKTVLKKIADPSKPGGFDLLQEQSGWTPVEIAIDALWGHAHVKFNDAFTNKNIRAFLKDAFENKNNRQDYPIVHSDPSVEKYVQKLIKSPNPAEILNKHFLKMQARSFSTPAIARPEQYKDYPYAGGYRPYNMYG